MIHAPFRDDRTSPADSVEDEIEALVFEYLERAPREGPQVIEAVLKDHPEHDEAVRRQLRLLRDLGLL